MRVGAPDASLTAVLGMVAVSELCDRLLVARRQVLLALVTIDLDTTDVEVYGRRKRGVA